MLAYPEQKRAEALALFENLLHRNPDMPCCVLFNQVAERVSISPSTLRLWVYNSNKEPLWQAFMRRMRPASNPAVFFRNLPPHKAGQLADMVIQTLPKTGYNTLQACNSVAKETDMPWLDVHKVYCLERIRRAMVPRSHAR